MNINLPLVAVLMLTVASPAFAVSYGDYEGAAIQESGAVNANRSTGLNPMTPASSDIGLLDKRRFVQVSRAIEEIGRRPGFKAEAERLENWLTRGFILVDSTLDSGTSAETRRDGSSKPFLAPDGGPVGSDKVCLDGNIYLNAGKELLFFPPSNLAAIKTSAAKLAEKRKSGRALSGSQQQLLEHLLVQMDAPLSFLYLQSILVHEATHTQQRWGGQAAKEGAAYARQLDYLRALLPGASPEDAGRVEFLIRRVKADTGEQAK